MQLIAFFAAVPEPDKDALFNMRAERGWMAGIACAT